MPSLPDSSFKLQKSLTKRKLVSKSWAGQAFWKNSECFSANRLQNGENTNVNKALLLIPIPSLSSPNVKSTWHPLPSRAGDDRTRTDVLFPPAQALINNLQVLIFDPFMAANCDPKSPSPLFLTDPSFSLSLYHVTTAREPAELKITLGQFTFPRCSLTFPSSRLD